MNTLPVRLTHPHAELPTRTRNSRPARTRPTRALTSPHPRPRTSHRAS